MLQCLASGTEFPALSNTIPSVLHLPFAQSRFTFAPGLHARDKSIDHALHIDVQLYTAMNASALPPSPSQYKSTVRQSIPARFSTSPCSHIDPLGSHPHWLASTWCLLLSHADNWFWICLFISKRASHCFLISRPVTHMWNLIRDFRILALKHPINHMLDSLKVHVFGKNTIASAIVHFLNTLHLGEFPRS